MIAAGLRRRQPVAAAAGVDGETDNKIGLWLREKLIGMDRAYCEAMRMGNACPARPCAQSRGLFRATAAPWRPHPQAHTMAATNKCLAQSNKSRQGDVH